MSFIHVNVLYLTIGLIGLNTCILLVTEFELQVSAVLFLPDHFGLGEQWKFFFSEVPPKLWKLYSCP